jgi:penicillin-binding protein 2
LRFGRRRFKCWNLGGHGRVSLIRGIAQSCDVYFYNVGLKVGVDALHHYAHRYGLGEKTGIEIAFENPGLIPSTEWKKRRYGRKWIESETLSLAIGQGYNLLTPLQAARMIAMVANGGKPLTPHLGKRLVNPADKSTVKIQTPQGKPILPDRIIGLVQEGVIEVVHGAGTAKRMRASPYKIAGKTGTAQVIGHDSRAKRSQRTKPHGWFVGYAPYDQPKIAVAAIVENGGSGGAAAGPVVMKVIDTYLAKIMPLKKKNTGR